jgi:hypothetical protein
MNMFCPGLDPRPWAALEAESAQGQQVATGLVRPSYVIDRSEAAGGESRQKWLVHTVDHLNRLARPAGLFGTVFPEFDFTSQFVAIIP